jgi:hypothetical protein
MAGQAAGLPSPFRRPPARFLVLAGRRPAAPGRKKVAGVTMRRPVFQIVLCGADFFIRPSRFDRCVHRRDEIIHLPGGSVKGARRARPLRQPYRLAGCRFGVALTGALNEEISDDHPQLDPPPVRPQAPHPPRLLAR